MPAAMVDCLWQLVDRDPAEAWLTDPPRLKCQPASRMTMGKQRMLNTKLIGKRDAKAASLSQCGPFAL